MEGRLRVTPQFFLLCEIVVIIGIGAWIVGLRNAEMILNEKG